MKIAKLRVKLDFELDLPLEHFRTDEPGWEGRVRFFFEESHCTENLTRKALELLQEKGERASAEARAAVGQPDASWGACVTCQGADVELLGVEEAPAASEGA
jgi:hypothetical protein